jgi:hypothetical protein
LVVLLAAGCAPAARLGQQAGPVPWVNRPAPAYVPLPQPAPAAAYPPCRARQLIGRPGRGGPAAGTVYQQVRLTNRSGRPCTLSGGPSAVTGVLERGGMTTLARTALGDGFNLAGPGPANLRPGHSGWVTLAWGDGCPALTSDGKAGYRTLFIVLGNGGRVRVAFAVTRCHGVTSTATSRACGNCRPAATVNRPEPDPGSMIRAGAISLAAHPPWTR